MLEGVFGNATAEKVLLYLEQFEEGYALGIARTFDDLHVEPALRVRERASRAPAQGAEAPAGGRARAVLRGAAAATAHGQALVSEVHEGLLTRPSSAWRSGVRIHDLTGF